MDISEFLSSMQPDMGSRSLARNVVQKGPGLSPFQPGDMSALDHMNDRTLAGGEGNMFDRMPPSMGGSRSMGGGDDESSETQLDDDMGFEDGGAIPDDDDGNDGGDESGDKYKDLPDSENIEDRRGEDSGGKDNMGAYDANQYNLKNNSKVTNWGEAWSKTQDKIGSKFFDEGGAVDDGDEDDPAPGQNEIDAETKDETGPDRPRAARGAIPDGGPADDDQPPPGRAQDDDQYDADLKAVEEGLDYGRNRLHGVNRPVSDEGHEGDVHDYLSGKGSISHDQFQQAERAVDPDGTLGEGERSLRTIGSLHRFYGEKDPEQAAPAAHAGLQYVRKTIDAALALATVASEKGDDGAAATLYEKALNRVPDGTSVKVEAPGAAPRGLDGGTMPRHIDVPDKPAAPGASGRPFEAMEGNPPLLHAVERSPGLPARTGPSPKPAIPETAAPAPAGAAPGAPPGAPVGDMPLQPGQSRRLQVSMDPNKYTVTTYDDATGKEIARREVSREAMADIRHVGFDRLVHHGVDSVLGGLAPAPDQNRARTPQERLSMLGTRPVAPEEAAKEGAPAPAADKRDAAERNGLPRGMNIDGLTIGQISQLRARYASGQLQQLPAQDLERIKQEGSTGRTRLTQEGLDRRGAASNTSQERRSRITAGVDPDTGQPTGNPTGRAAQNIGQDNRLIEARTKAAIERMPRPPTEDQIGQIRQRERDAYYKEQGRSPPGTTVPERERAASGSGRAAEGEIKMSGGKQYRYDATRRGWVPVGG